MPIFCQIKLFFLPISSVFVLMSPDFAYFVTCFCNITNPLNALTIPVYQTAPTGRTWLWLHQAGGASNCQSGVCHFTVVVSATYGGLLYLLIHCSIAQWASILTR